MQINIPKMTVSEIKELLTTQEFDDWFGIVDFYAKLCEMNIDLKQDPKEVFDSYLNLINLKNDYDLTKEKLNKVIAKHPLRYLMSNNPDEVVSKFGVKTRVGLFYLLKPFLKIMNPYEVDWVRKEPLSKTNRPIIFTANHGFKDDLLNVAIMGGKPSYTLFGSLEQFYQTKDGYLANLTGVSMVDRDDKESRRTVIDKWTKAMSYGINGIVFPEGIWCLDPLLLAHNLWPGFYRGLKAVNGILVVNALHIERTKKGKDILHVLRGECIDLVNAFKLLSMTVQETAIKLNYLSHSIDDVVESVCLYLQEKGIDLEDAYNFELAIKILVEEIRHLDANINEISEEELARKAIRSYLASLHYELLSSCGIKHRNECPSYYEMKKEWDAEVQRRQKEPEYYTWNESDYRYCEEHEKNVISQEEVFSPLDNVRITKENQEILCLTKNMFRT